MVFKLLDEPLHHVSILLETTAAPYRIDSSKEKGLLQGLDYGPRPLDGQLSFPTSEE